MPHRFVVWAGLSLCAFTLHAAPGPEDVGKSWDNARVYVTSSESFLKSPKDVKLDKPMPVILFMHGCSGIQAAETGWAPFLRQNGFVVVLPDSFARERPQSCDPRTGRGGLFPGVFRFRADELRYAMAQLQSSPWADSRNIFLMGHSEGGVQVALTPVTGLRGAIVSGWVCTSPSAPNTGLRTALDLPLLVLDHERDPFYAASPGRRCSEFFGARTKARQVTLPGEAHNTFEPDAQQPVLDFLNENLRK